jgi:histidine triad (HIT) family protein
MHECIFCKIIAGDLPSHKIYEDDDVLAFLDVKPLNPGHTLVVPKCHAENVMDSSEEDILAVMRAIKKIAPALLRATGASACNVSTNHGAAAGQVVFHTHFHVIPRHDGDGYAPWRRNETMPYDPVAVAEKIRHALEV